MKLRHHKCHDCPSDTKLCKDHPNKLCLGFAMKSWSTNMAGQAMKRHWDGHFRFPRHHLNGRSLQDFSVQELIVLRNNCIAIWQIWWDKAKNIAKKDRPDWTPEIKDVHNRMIEATQEIHRKNRHNRT